MNLSGLVVQIIIPDVFFISMPEIDMSNANSRWSLSAPKLVMVFMLLLAIVSPLIHALKVARINYEIGAYVLYIGLPLVTIMVWWCLLRGRHRTPPTLFFMIFGGLIFATLISILQGGDLIDIVGNFIRLLFCAGMVQFGVVYRDNIVAFLPQHERVIAKLAMLSMFLAVAGLYISSFIGLGVYFGLQSTISFVSLSYGLVYRKYFFAIGSLVLIVLSGKRGVMAAAIVVVLVYLFSLFFSGKLKRFLILSLAALFMVVGVSIAGLVPDSILSRFDQFTSGEPTDWNKATAGRMTEIDGVVEIIADTPDVLIYGLGLGAAIKDSVGESDSTVHFSPLGLVLIWGIPLTLFLYMGLLFYSVKGIYVAGRKGFVYKDHALFWSLIYIGELVFSFSAFTILQSTMLWFSLAAVIAFTKGWSYSRNISFNH